MPRNAIEQVVAESLCAGCGLCAGHFGAQRVTMGMNHEGYLRPTVQGSLSAEEAQEFKQFCPGTNLQLKPQAPYDHIVWGPIHSCTAGWATDEETRYRGSSGGAISALLTSMLESGVIDFAAHIAADTAHPMRNALQISRHRADVLAAAGSRYAPSSPLADLGKLFEMPGRFAFVGKPCDVAALRGYLQQRPALAGRVVALLSFMCAGIPSEKGTVEIVHAMGAKTADVVRFNYRGDGWPGYATATLHDGRALQMDYATSWGTILNKHLQFRCKICPDGTGEFADLVCADAWYGKDGYPDFEERAGRSLIVARTPQGQAILQAALIGKYLANEDCPIADISLMQPYQESRKRLLASRLLALLLRRGRIPHFGGLRLLRAASGVGLMLHIRNLLGTLKRIPKSTGLSR
jgi:coenzyme F420 hydrogenase subunit beta